MQQQQLTSTREDKGKNGAKARRWGQENQEAADEVFFPFPSHKPTVHLSKITMNFFVKREKCAILSVTVWASFPLLYIGYLPKSLSKHHTALAFVPALKRCHTCFMFKVLTKIRHCARVIQDHNHNRMRNYSGK